MPTVFTIPQELRDQIFDHVWYGTPWIILARGKFTWCTDYDCDFRDMKPGVGLPSLLFASKSILEEGLKTFERRGQAQPCSHRRSHRARLLMFLQSCTKGNSESRF